MNSSIIKYEFLSSLPLAELIADDTTIECHDIDAQLRTVELQEENAKQALNLLKQILQISDHFNDPAEPYGPMMQMDGKRTMIVSDLFGEQANELSKFVPEVENISLKARLADVVWLNDRKRRDMAETAIEAYAQRVEQYLDGEAEFRFKLDSLVDHRILELLRRAFQIAKATKGKNEYPDHLTALIARIKDSAFTAKDIPGITRIAKLELDYQIYDELALASAIEEALEKEQKNDAHWNIHLLEELTRIYRRNEKSEDASACQIRIAECYVQIADAAGSSMVEAHWLMKAVDGLRRARGGKAKTRIKTLRERLKEVQQDTVFEMGTISTLIDLTELVNHTKVKFEDLSFGMALGFFASIHVSEKPDKLKAEAAKQASEHPMSHMFGSEHLDQEGKVLARTKGGDFGSVNPEEDAINTSVSQNLSLSRNVKVAGEIEPARRLIQASFRPTVAPFEFLVEHSPFVPNHHEGIFALGFVRFFQGDMVTAASLLIPQLENSMRYILKTSGSNPSSIESDLTQDDRSISSLLLHDREKLDEILGVELVYEIDMLFNFRPGPSLRHEIAHGKLPTGHFYSPDVVFACWLLFRITCIPLFDHWDEYAGKLDEH